MERMTEKEHSPEDFVLIVNQLKLWTLTSDVPYLRDTSRKSFSSLVQRYKAQFQEICNKEYITDLLSNESYCNKSQVVMVLMVIVSLFNSLPPTNKPRLTFFRQLSLGLLEFLRREGGDVSVSSAVAQMLITFPETRPGSLSETSSLCKILVTLLSRLTVPTKPGSLARFRQDVLKISSVLPIIWDSGGRREEVMGES